jgi:hypothetical protein
MSIRRIRVARHRGGRLSQRAWGWRDTKRLSAISLVSRSVASAKWNASGVGPSSTVPSIRLIRTEPGPDPSRSSWLRPGRTSTDAAQGRLWMSNKSEWPLLRCPALAIRTQGSIAAAQNSLAWLAGICGSSAKEEASGLGVIGLRDDLRACMSPARPRAHGRYRFAVIVRTPPQNSPCEAGRREDAGVVRDGAGDQADGRMRSMAIRHGCLLRRRRHQAIISRTSRYSPSIFRLYRRYMRGIAKLIAATPQSCCVPAAPIPRGSTAISGSLL